MPKRNPIPPKGPAPAGEAEAAGGSWHSRRLQMLAATAGAIVIGVLVWQLWPAPAQQAPGPDARELQRIKVATERIEDLAKAGKTAEAADALRDLLAEYPDPQDTVRLHGMLAVLLLQLHRDDEAVEVMRNLARRLPNNIEAGQKLAALYGTLGRDQEAAAELRRLTDQFPNDAQSPMLLGSLLANKMDQVSEGEKYLREARRRDPRNPVVAGLLAGALAKRGELNEAITLYREAIASPVNRLDNRMELAKVLYGRFSTVSRKEGEPYLREAIRNLQAALRERQEQLGPKAGQQPDPILARCYAQTAELYAQLGEYDPAVGHLQWAIRFTKSSDPNYSFLWLNMARYGLEGKKPDVLQAAREAIDRYWPRDAQLAYHLGLLYDAVERHQEAVQQYLLAEQYDPKYAEPYRQMAETYLREGKLAEANDQVFKGLEIAPRNPMLIQLKDQISAAIRAGSGLPPLIEESPESGGGSSESESGDSE